MFHEQEIGEVAWVQMFVQAPAPKRYSRDTLARPEPASAAVPAIVTLPVRGEPGSVVVAVGAVLSTRRFVTVSVRE